jgi:hypothetical protein
MYLMFAMREEMVHALTRMGTVNNAEEEAEKCMQVRERVKCSRGCLIV